MWRRAFGARRFQRDGFHLRDHQRGRDARRVQGVRRGRDRDVHVRHDAPAPRPVHTKLRAGRQGLGMGRVLGQHRFRVQVRQDVRGHGRTGPQPPRKDEPAQQRSRPNGEWISIIFLLTVFSFLSFFLTFIDKRTADGIRGLFEKRPSPGKSKYTSSSSSFTISPIIRNSLRIFFFKKQRNQ